MDQPTPLPAAYVDTCIVSGLAKNDIGRDELLALRRILEGGADGRVKLATSNLTRDEIRRIPEQYRAPHEAELQLLGRVPAVWLHRAITQIIPSTIFSAGTREDPLYSDLARLLPDRIDAEHVFQTARNGMTYLLTVDRATLLKYRREIESLCGVLVVTPIEFERAVRLDG